MDEDQQDEFPTEDAVDWLCVELDGMPPSVDRLFEDKEKFWTYYHGSGEYEGPYNSLEEAFREMPLEGLNAIGPGVNRIYSEKLSADQISAHLFVYEPDDDVYSIPINGVIFEVRGEDIVKQD